jgi:glycosyltransferase involved in cell wall biosynthesis
MSEVKCLLLSVRADVGGGPEHMHLLLRGLQERFDFIVGAPTAQAYSPRFASLAHLHDLPFRRFSLLALLRLARLVRSTRVDLIHSHGKGAGIYARLLGWITGRPVVHTFHGFHYLHLPPFKRWVYLVIERWLARRTAVLLNVSQSEQDACRKAGVLENARSLVIPNGVCVPADWKNPAERPGRGPLVLVNVGRHDSEKGVDGLVHVARELNLLGVDFTLWLIGDGEQGQKLRKQVAADGLSERVQFMGVRDDVPALLPNADIFVSASHGEGMPLTLLEAMAAGLPIVASDVVGNRDVVENGQTGFLFQLGNPVMAAHAIAQLARDPVLFAHCSRTAHARALERYSVGAMCERISQVYSSIVSNQDTDNTACAQR